MTTINVSITDDQAKFIDQIAKKFNFENRSELIRSFIRLFQFQPKLIEENFSFPFITPNTHSRSKVLKDFKSTGKYSDAFLKDLSQGLKDSRFFNEK
jgi:AraC-like DNA-binding protein